MPAGGRTTVRSRRLGKALRDARLTAGLDQEEAATELRCSTAKISRIETGHNSPRPLDVVILLRLYGVADDSEEMNRLEALSKESNRRGWWVDYGNSIWPGYADHISLENDATHISEWTSLIIPGLCQAEEYARKAIENGATLITEERIGELLNIRRQRQERILNGGVYYTAIIWEPLIRTPAWGLDIHERQLNRLADMANQKNITIQVLPSEAIAIAGLAGPFAAFSFAAEPAIEAVTVIHITNTTVLEDQAALNAYSRTFDQLRSAALTPDQSSKLISSHITGKGQ